MVEVRKGMFIFAPPPCPPLAPPWGEGGGQFLKIHTDSESILLKPHTMIEVKIGKFIFALPLATPGGIKL